MDIDSTLSTPNYIECDHIACTIRIAPGDITPDDPRFLEMAEYYGWKFKHDYDIAYCPLHNAIGMAIRILFEIFGHGSQMQKYIQYV